MVGRPRSVATYRLSFVLFDDFESKVFSIDLRNVPGDDGIDGCKREAIEGAVRNVIVECLIEFLTFTQQ